MDWGDICFLEHYSKHKMKSEISQNMVPFLLYHLLVIELLQVIYIFCISFLKCVYGILWQKLINKLNKIH